MIIPNCQLLLSGFLFYPFLFLNIDPVLASWVLSLLESLCFPNKDQEQYYFFARLWCNAMPETPSLLVSRNYNFHCKILSLHSAALSLWFLSLRKSIVQTTIFYCPRVEIGGEMKEFIDLVGLILQQIRIVKGNSFLTDWF